MGYYLNNDVCYEAYRYIAQMTYFVDKSEILDELISVINTENRFICITRPRRFGKTAAANLAASFFSKGCNSEGLFNIIKQEFPLLLGGGMNCISPDGGEISQ